MRQLLNNIVKYNLWCPWVLAKLLYYNSKFIRPGHSSKAIFMFAKSSVFDISKTARIYINQKVLFGWCNMKKSNIETALCMGENSQLVLGQERDTNKWLNIGYGSYLQIGKDATLRIGDSFINREVKIICNTDIEIGNDCLIAMGTVIRDNDGGNHKILTPPRIY